MTTSPFNTRWNEIKTIWQNNPFLYGIIGFFLGIMALPIIERIGELPTLLRDSVPEVFGIIFTVIVIDRLYRNYEQSRELSEELKRLLIELKSTKTAKNAYHQINEKGWWQDGSLEGRRFERAKLSKVSLEKAKLRGSDFSFAKLKSTNLGSSDLRWSKFWNANLSKPICKMPI